MLFGIVFVFLIAVIRDRPDSPPSAIAEVPEKRLNFKETCVLLRENVDFRILAVCFMLSNGQFSAFGATLSDTLTPYGITPKDIGYLGGIFVLVGIILSAVIGKRLDKNGKYKKTQLWLIIIMTAFLSISLVFMFFNLHKYVITITMTLFASLQMPLIPVSFSYGNELTFPVHPALTQGVMVAATSLSTSVQLIVYNAIFGWAYNDAGGMIDLNDHDLSPEEVKIVENS